MPMLRTIAWLATRPLVTFWIGLNVRGSEHLPSTGPFVIVANHNSHLDVFALAAMLRWQLLGALRPVGAEDYFFKGRIRRWIFTNLLGLIPIRRGRPARGEDPFAPLEAALQRGEILIVFPEGSRGDPESLAPFKPGIARIAERCPSVPIIPVYTWGLGRCLPRGEALLVPFNCDVFVGEPVPFEGDRKAFMDRLQAAMAALQEQVGARQWQ